MQKDHLVPLSILLGCATIAAGLYFGLRSRPQAAASDSISPHGQPATPTGSNPAQRTSPVSPAMLSPGMAGVPATGTPALPGVPPDVQAAAERAAHDALLGEKKRTLLPKCWQPALAQRPEPAIAKFRLNMMFDAQGREVGRGLHEDRSAIRTDVANCIRNQAMTLQISPPGVPVSVTVPLDFP